MRTWTRAATCALLVGTIGCNADDSPDVSVRSTEGAASPPSGVQDRGVLVFRGNRLVIWRGAQPVFPPVVPGSALSPHLFKSTAPDVVRVESNGAIVGLRPGTASLVSKSNSTMTVVVHDAQGLAVSPPVVRFAAGATMTVSLSSSEGAIAPGDVDWLTDSPSIISVERGVINGAKAGTALLIVRAGANTVTATVTVTDANRRSIAVLGPTAPLQRGAVFQIYPREGATGLVEWTSTAPTVVKPLSGGIFQAMASGRAEACIRSANAHGCAPIVVR